MSVRNLIVSPQDGWVEVANTGSGFVTAGSGLQHCIYTGTPPVDLIGHRYARKPIQYSLSAGESLWARASQPVFVVVTGEPLRSEWFLRFDGEGSYGVFQDSVVVNSGELICVLFTYDRTPDTFQPIFDSESITNRIVARRGNAEVWDFAGLTNMMVDGSPVSSGDSLPLDGLPHVLTAEATMSGLIKYVGTNFATSVFWGGIVANLTVADKSAFIDQKGSVIQDRPNSSNPITLHNVDQVNDWVTI